MKRQLLVMALVALTAAPAMAAQQNITTVSSATASREALRVAINSRLTAADSNFDELYAAIGTRPWVAQATAPADTTLIWFDTDQVAGSVVLKIHTGGVWVAHALGEAGAEYTLPAATASALGGVIDGDRVTIAGDGTISADWQPVGDCTVGPCLDGSADGGNLIKLYAGTGSYWTALQGGAPAANRSWRLPILAPPSAGETNVMTMDEYGQMAFLDKPSTSGYVLSSTDAGVLSWAAPGAASGDDLGDAAYTDVVALWTTCTGYLRSDGTCDTPSGSFSWPASDGAYYAAKDGAWASLATVYQPLDSDLTTWAGVTSTANGRSLVSAANYAAMRTLLDLEVGTDFNAYDADLGTWAGITPGTGVGAALANATNGASGIVTLNASSQLPAVSAALLTNFPTLNQNTTGSAATLTTARTIGGVSFNGSANINLPGVNTAGNQNTTGTAAGLTAQYIDWSASSGGNSIANKPTIPTASDTAYDATSWNGNNDVPTKNAIRDKIETISSGTDDQTAVEVNITDIGSYYTGTTVEAALQEVGADFAAMPNLSAGTGITITEDGGGAGVDTIAVTTNTYQAYDANMITWPSTISATEVGYLNGLTEALSTSLSGKQAADADLTTYAGITPSVNVQSLLGAANYAAMKTLLDTDDIQTLTGIAAGTANLGTFTGTTIADSSTIKTALQSLETSVEGKQALDSDLTTWAGITPGTGVGTMLAIAPGSAGGPTTTIASGTSALGTSAISSGACASVVTTTATNVATTDVINWGFNSDPTGVTGYAPSANGMLTIIAYPSSGSVNYKVCNNTAASITPGAVTINWRVQR